MAPKMQTHYKRKLTENQIVLKNHWAVFRTSKNTITPHTSELKSIINISFVNLRKIFAFLWRYMNYKMVLFTLIPMDFLAYVTIQFFQTQTLLWHSLAVLILTLILMQLRHPATILLKINLTKCSDAKIILMPISLSYILIFVVFLII